jgi:hypothetical protein
MGEKEKVGEFSFDLNDCGWSVGLVGGRLAVDLGTWRLLAWPQILGGWWWLRTRVMECNYCGGSIMVAVGAEEGVG